MTVCSGWRPLSFYQGCMWLQYKTDEGDTVLGKEGKKFSLGSLANMVLLFYGQCFQELSGVLLLCHPEKISLGYVFRCLYVPIGRWPPGVNAGLWGWSPPGKQGSRTGAQHTQGLHHLLPSLGHLVMGTWIGPPLKSYQSWCDFWRGSTDDKEKCICVSLETENRGGKEFNRAGF